MIHVVGEMTVVDEDFWWWEDALPILGMHPLTYYYAYTLYNISFTILDAHVTNTSPIHHQTLFMMYKYVKNNSNIHVLACNIKIKITSWRHGSCDFSIKCLFFAENNAGPYISHGFLQFWGHSKVFHAVKPRQSDCIIDNQTSQIITRQIVTKLFCCVPSKLSSCSATLRWVPGTLRQVVSRLSVAWSLNKSKSITVKKKKNDINDKK